MKKNQIISKIIVVAFCCYLLFSCNKKQGITQTNDLIYETSPYLLQHAKNPVNWKAWNDKTLELAKKENKLMVISIGYSACHWCHVMEEESFENDSIAKIMNENFINIKVDREERPDVDNIYMDAVQLMTGKGGWPLNCITLPNGKPIFGGTYFTKEQWEKVLIDISKLYKENPNKAIEFADRLTEGIQKSGLITLNNKEVDFKDIEIQNSIEKWKENFDLEFGSTNNDIKFPMPNTLDFLLRYSFQLEDVSIKNHLKTSLTKMAYGGIYDQVNGGFSRYATDKKWHIPHFEKMLYDNAQLVSLYSKAYQESKNELYKNVVIETLNFVENELTAKNGAFYSSLDADSKNIKNEKEEGAYYYWSKEELANLITKNWALFEDYYNINDFGLWEKDRFVLIRKLSNEVFTNKHKLNKEQFLILLKEWKKILKKAREKKERPNLDDKVLTSWNALMIKAYVDAYKVIRNDTYLKNAIKNANFIVNHQLKKNGNLLRNYKNGKSTIDAYAEDYATLIDAFIALYEVTFDEKWLVQSKKLMSFTLENFYNKENSMFYYTSYSNNNLISRKIEVIDGVISSSNSILANSLFKLGLYYSDSNYHRIAHQMLKNLKKDVLNNPSNYSNWLQLMLNFSRPFYEVVISGNQIGKIDKEISEYYIPNIIIAGSKHENNSLPLLTNKFIEDETFIYVCNLGTCKLPQKEVEKALKSIQK